MKIKHLITAAIAALALTSASAFAETKVRLGHGNPSFGLLQVFVAQEGGFFEKEGLDVELIKLGSGAKTIAAVVGGAADVVATAASAALYSQAQGADLVVFGQLMTGYHTPIVYSKNWMEKHDLTMDSPFVDRLAALKGARIATTGPGGGDQLIRFYAEKAGINADQDMTILHLGSDLATYLGALDADRIDGFAIGAPNSIIAVREKGGAMALNPPDGEAEEIDGFLYVSTVANREWIEKNPETVQAFARAFQNALDAIQDPDQDHTLRDSVRTAYFDNVSEDIFAEAWEQAKHTSARSFTVDPGAMEQVANFIEMFDPVEITPEMMQRSFVEITP